MIIQEITKQILMSIIRPLIAHKKIAISIPGLRICVVEIKPARKGKIYGRGGTDKKNKFDFRLKVTFTEEFKRFVERERDKMI